MDFEAAGRRRIAIDGGPSMRISLVLLLTTLAFSVGAVAQDRPAVPPAVAPGVVTEGSGNVSIGGQSGARKGDRTDGDGAIVEGSSNVFINGKPAATMGDKTGCGGITVGGGGGVFINGKPAARAGDMTTGCPGK
jgi:uncharacterized Zn-binding protein involved in type VI secretion